MSNQANEAMNSCDRDRAVSDRAEVEQAAQANVQQLKKEADNMLLTLMLEQQSRLNEMVQQLQNTQRSNAVTGKLSPEHDASPAHETILDSTAMADGVAGKQQTTMLHLDAVIQRINATMNSSLITPDIQSDLDKQEGTENEQNDTAIRDPKG